MNAVYWIKYLVFLVTPHLLFDRIAYWLAKVDKHLLESYGFERKRNFIVERMQEYRIISFP